MGTSQSYEPPHSVFFSNLLFFLYLGHKHSPQRPVFKHLLCAFERPSFKAIQNNRPRPQVEKNRVLEVLNGDPINVTWVI
jgi:hypothetical protein